MRLSAWRTAAPHRDAVTAKVAAVVDPVLLAFGAEEDPHCWVAWGDEPGTRFMVLVPTDPGLITCFVRVNVPMEGPRASAKLIRWNRVAIGELGVETQAGHRILSFQIEQNVLRGVDVEADRVAAFALRVIAAIDGRPLPPDIEPARRRTVAGSTPKKATGAGSGPKASAAAGRSATAGRASGARRAGAATAPKRPSPSR
jgi:hypothetical protein